MGDTEAYGNGVSDPGDEGNELTELLLHVGVPDGVYILFTGGVSSYTSSSGSVEITTSSTSDKRSVSGSACV